jgi:CHAD domain-containing protein
MSLLLTEHGTRSLERFASALEKLRARSSEGRIHALRIRTKKLRSLFRVIQALAPDATPPKRAHARMKALFHAAGALRETQVSARLVGELPHVPDKSRKAYLARLKKRRAKAGKELDKRLSRLDRKDITDLGAFINSAAEGFGVRRERQGARQYIDTELALALERFRSGDPSVVLHDVRKHVKNAWHTLRLLDDAGALYVAQRPVMERLDKLQEELGAWHDSHVVLADLAQWERGGASRERLVPAAEKQLAQRQRKLLAELEAVLVPNDRK